MKRITEIMKDWAAVIVLSLLLLLMVSAFVVCFVCMISGVNPTLPAFGCVGCAVVVGVTWPQLMVEIRARRAK